MENITSYKYGDKDKLTPNIFDYSDENVENLKIGLSYRFPGYSAENDENFYSTETIIVTSKYIEYKREIDNGKNIVDDSKLDNHITFLRMGGSYESLVLQLVELNDIYPTYCKKIEPIWELICTISNKEKTIEFRIPSSDQETIEKISNLLAPYLFGVATMPIFLRIPKK